MIIASVYPFPFHIGLGHDANVAILSPTQVFSYEEGKLSGDVMPCFPGFPQRALAAGFRQHAIGPKDVDHWVFGRPFRTDVDHSLTHFFHHLKLPSSHLEALRAQGRLHFVDHHTGHAALAVHGSGFERGSFLTYDGGGDEFQPCVMSHGTFADGILQVEGLSPSESPGIANLYDCLAAATGFIAPVETGKFMGLAGYGRADPELYSKLQSLLEDTPLGRRYALSKIRRDKYTPYRFDRYDCDTYNYFKVYYSPVAPAAVEACTRFHSAPDVAATAQCLLQETMLRIVEQVVPKGGTTDLVLAGGLFQNIVLNDAIAQQSRAARVYVPMAPSDGGLSLGAALTVERRLGVSRQRFLMSPFLGPAFTESQIEAAFSKNHIAYSKPKSIVHTAADLIAEGNIIGWFQGRAELGPRALGARSILADPRRIESKYRLNRMLKKRDWFMPYAPAILAESIHDYLVSPRGSPYMSFCSAIREERRSDLLAAVHADGTCRPQVVRSDGNRMFYELIRAFSARTSVPAVLNTSFNRHGIATIASPHQAIRHLLTGNIDGLAIGPFVAMGTRASETRNEIDIPDSMWLLAEALRPLLQCLREEPNRSETEVARIRKRFPWARVKVDASDHRLTVCGEVVPLFPDERSDLYRFLEPILAEHAKYRIEREAE